MGQVAPLPDTTVVIYMGTFAPQCAEVIYRPLARIFEARGYPVVMKSLPRLGLGPLDEASDELARNMLAPDHRYILIGHSQGGLHAFHHARYYEDMILAVVGFGVPFHGTRLANLGTLLRMMPAVRTMAAHSRYLHELREDQTYQADNVYSMFSVLDELVVPWFASSVAGAHNIVLAPRFLHPMLINFGLSRSNGVELVDGWAEHIGVIWHPSLHHYIEHVLDQIEGRHSQAVA